MDEEFFTLTKKAFFEDLCEAWAAATHADPILSRIQRTIYDHGNTSTLVDVEGIERISESEAMISSFELHTDEIEAGDTQAFQRIIRAGVEQLRKQMSELLFRRLSAAAQEVGNLIHWEGAPLTAELFYALFERIEFTFENGKPKIPALILHPDLHERAREILERPEVQLRLDAIIRNKWLDHYMLKTRKP